MQTIDELLDWARACHDGDGPAADKPRWRAVIALLERLSPQAVDEEALRAAFRAYRDTAPDVQIEWSLFGMHRAVRAYLETGQREEV